MANRYHYIVLELPFSAHTTPMPDDADLSPRSPRRSPNSSPNRTSPGHSGLQRLGWRATPHQPRGTDRVTNLVLVSCETFDNYPPGFPSQLLCATAALPGGTFLVAQLGCAWMRHLLMVFRAMSKRRVPEGLFRR